jgi:DNA-binding MurR/RpiR family transcriptional regulator
MDARSKPAAALESLGYTVPATYEELRAVLSSGTAQMPKKLRQIAIFMWQHADDVALGSSASVALQAGVQPSTLVRFAQSLGFSGFSDLQELFKAHVKASLPASRPDASPVRRHAERLPKVLGGLVAAAQESLSRLEATFDNAAFEAVVQSVARARTIYILGSKRAFPIAHYMSLTLFQQGVLNVLIDNIGSVAMDQVTCLSKGDVVLAIGFSPYNSITRDVAAAASDNGAEIVALTDSEFSPLVQLASSYVEIVESNHAGFRSLSSTTVVAMSLVLAVVQARAELQAKAAHQG